MAAADLIGATLIGFGTSLSFDSQQRWTECRIHYRTRADGTPQRRPFVASIAGCSNVPGETEQLRTKSAQRFEEAIAYLGGGSSQPAADAIAQADAWIEEHPEALLMPTIAGYDGAPDLRGALGWLYRKKPDATDADLAREVEQDFGVVARTVRHQLKQERDGSPLSAWAAAFVRALRHFDRVAFERAKGNTG